MVLDRPPGRTGHLVLQHASSSLSDSDSPSATFSTSSSASSLASSSYLSAVSSLSGTADSTADTTLSSLSPCSPSFPSSRRPSLQESARRSAARPSPLTLHNSSSSSSASASSKSRPDFFQRQYLPRTSSLSSLPRIATITTTSRRSQSVASTRASRCYEYQQQQQQQSFGLAEPLATVPVASIRRKPLPAAVIPDAAATTTTITAASSVGDPIEEEDDAHAALDLLDDLHDVDNLDHLDHYLDLEDDLDYLPTPAQRFTRSCSVDSPTLYEFPDHILPKTTSSPLSISRGPEPDSESESSENRSSAVLGAAALETRDADLGSLASHDSSANTPAARQTDPAATPSHHVQDLTANHQASDQIPADDLFERETAAQVEEGAVSRISADSTMSFFSRKTSPPHLSLKTSNKNKDKDNNLDQDSVYSAYQEKDSDQQNLAVPPLISPSSTGTVLGDSSKTLKSLPKSPVSSKFGTFFGWSSASPSSTEFSDGAFSPLPSPLATSTTITHASTASTQRTNTGSSQDGDFPNKNSSNSSGNNPLGYLENLQTPPVAITPPQPSPSAAAPTQSVPSSVQIDEMEDELKAIGAELAASIRREMDLEDLVDRLQAEVNNPPGKRTSDYFSDSGYSSAKLSDYDAAKEEVAQIQRRAEQERAQLRLDLTEKLTDERTRRKVLDQQIKELSERAASIDLAEMQRSNEDASGRMKQLEGTCEDLRRRLNEERGVKENFEDLLSAIKGELQSATNERDNLRDEVVPQLRARLEGLESQATENARQIYETTKMQQELQLLKDENQSLRTASETRPQQSSSSNGLSRSNTVKHQQQQQPPSGQSVTVNESRESLVERLKDVEAQRDALHSALKSLLDRQEFQTRENDKKIRVLETERERLLAASPKKAGYERDVANLREEISALRKRAEEALEQKWQFEKGLGGLRMDLDRAEEEIAELRSLLRQNDILAPPSAPRSRGLSGASSTYEGGDSAAAALAASEAADATSASLEKAYRELQASYKESLERIRSLEAAGSLPAEVHDDEKTTLALKRLDQALASAVADRNDARQEAAALESRLAESTAAEKALLESERSLASQLDASAQQVEDLAQQVRAQLAINEKLRERLSAMVSRGETDQQAHKERIAGLEARLRTLEEQLVASQTAAEERVARHEEQVATLHEAHNNQLQRLRDASGLLRPVSAVSSRPPSRSGGSGSGAAPTAAAGGNANLAAPGALGRPRSPLSPRTPMSPMFSINGRLVPSRPGSRSAASSTNGDDAAALQAEQAAQVSTLRARVGELESALASADQELQEVVGRMNSAQIEVLQLQEERETAVRETRRLQRQLEAEQVKSFEERFRMLSSATVQ